MWIVEVSVKPIGSQWSMASGAVISWGIFWRDSVSHGRRWDFTAWNLCSKNHQQCSFHSSKMGEGLSRWWLSSLKNHNRCAALGFTKNPVAHSQRAWGMAWLEQKKHPSLYPDVENVVSQIFRSWSHNISIAMWLCLLTYPKFSFRIYLLSTHHPNKIYQPSCANELQMSWQHAFNHLHGPLLQCLGHGVRGASWIQRDGFFALWA